MSLYADQVYSVDNHNKSNDFKYNILFVGRIDVLKGIPRFLKVIDRIVQKYPNIMLTLVGEVKEEVEHLFNLKKPYINLVGTKSKKELAVAYMAIPEAQAAGFWKIYDEFEVERKALGKVKVNIIEEYEDAY